MKMTRRNFLVTTAGAMAWGMRPAMAGTIGIGGPAFGSTWRAALPDADKSGAVRKLVTSVVAEINQAMSPYLAKSELSQFNRTDTLDWQNCSAPLATVADHALEMSKFTQGAFDPTIGPLVNRFGFGPIHGGRARPQDLSVSAEALRKAAPGLTLDLCGIAKGYALDRIIDSLPSVGVDTALFELGGEVRTLGRHPDARPWQVGIERPDAAPGLMAHIVAPGPMALATSGTGWQNVRLEQGGISHLIDPRTSRPVDAMPASVSVLADTAMRADGLATALMVMGMERGAAFAETHLIPALFVRLDNGGSHEIMTGGFEDYVSA
ncbi:membrane-associated lipoprotein involved in thiamine biosynthesis [Hoeflea sp. IMCC20628]|uniref:FAD:protein FMN transferase n=1 Tax=Hoeflea sp. IMCC20628 TaxID=1620421 RepID=UPI00063AE4CA|nr:FAD:protein FMN transferase [Hoeflea sp. IMCC20628]AKH98998.1 membrane-associated lipoprotein involved in thiamine biosynthesis [Hoeflea sp. IMCC20628]